MTYTLDEIFNQALEDKSSANVDSQGYEARIGYGTKITRDKKTGKVIIDIDPKYFRPSEVDFLKGDYSKAKKFLKWKPSISTNELIEDMVEYELSKIK